MAHVVIVLASGRSERFRAAGGTGNKLDADLCGRAVLQRTLDAVRESGLSWHLETGPHPGMGDSIAAAVRHCADASGWLILPGDLPLIQAQTIRQVDAALAHAPVVVPQAVMPDGTVQRGHPVGFSQVCRDALMALTGDMGAAPVVRAFGAQRLDVEDTGCCLDVDTPEWLDVARQRWLARQASPR